MHAELFLEQDYPDMMFPLDSAFPLRKVAFAGLQLSAPRDPEAVLELIYGDWLALPDDMFTHFQHVELGPQAAAALEALLDDGDGA